MPMSLFFEGCLAIAAIWAVVALFDIAKGINEIGEALKKLADD